VFEGYLFLHGLGSQTQWYKVRNISIDEESLPIRIRARPARFGLRKKELIVVRTKKCYIWSQIANRHPIFVLNEQTGQLAIDTLIILKVINTKPFSMTRRGPETGD
jgi:hypothetical protein